MLFILYPPGLGGNHLGNLIGLTTKVNFMQEEEVHKWYSQIEKKRGTAHVYIQKLMPGESGFDPNQPLAVGHFCTLEWTFIHTEEIKLPITQILVVRFPEMSNSVVINRNAKLLNEKINFEELFDQRAFYKQRIIEKLCPDVQVNEISSEYLFYSDLVHLNGELDSCGLGIDLKYDYLHKLWCKGNGIE